MLDDNATDEYILTLFQKALDSPLGLALQVSDQGVFRNRFYRLRTDNAPIYDQLSCRTSPKARDEVWLVKQGVKDNEPPQPTPA